MKSKPRYLTKSRYKEAIECPTKLFYTGKHEAYASKKLDDPFLRALARGGFQVGALAQCYYPEGIEVNDRDHDAALLRTNELLKQEDVTIFEAALRFENLFVRVDVLEKKGNRINLIEVKAKSVDLNTFEDELWNKPKKKKGIWQLNGEWHEYVYDVAFQMYVAKNAFPDWEIVPFLMCADKNKVATVEGLNQKFQIVNKDQKVEVILQGDVSPKALGDKVLALMDLKEVINIIHQGKDLSLEIEKYPAHVTYLSSLYEKDKKASPAVDTRCKGCEYRTTKPPLKSGFNECWQDAKKLTDDELMQPFSFDVWYSPKASFLLDHNILFMKDIDREMLGLKESESNGLGHGERQWLQIEKVKNNDKTPYFDIDGMAGEMEKFTFPLHFIDFETSTLAIPCHAGRKPYEQTAFQFSHHKVHADGKIEHATQYLNAKPGVFPNFFFLRNLKSALSGDRGTIFMYSGHENTVLCQIHEQLSRSSELDKIELQEFIESITRKTEGKGKNKQILWEGSRKIVDLRELVLKYFYHPSTNGSNSLKDLLPAVLNESQFLKKKYSQPIYGSKVGTPSHNFTEKAWVILDESGFVLDPYTQLPKIFKDIDMEQLDSLMDEGEELRNGAAALVAYSYLQFVGMAQEERSAVESALLKYCELDTLAMVMIWEYWADHIKQAKITKAI